MTAIRVGTLAAIVALLLPFELSAQRLPLPGRGRAGPARPTPLPPQPEPIARNLAYKRMRVSVESYPLISHVRSGLSGDGLASSWTSFGMGSRLDYRLDRHVSATLDVTSAFAGGPSNVSTAELGVRFASERSGRTLYRFIDVRVGYTDASSSYFDPVTGGVGYSTQGGSFRSSDGFGAVAGIGFEYALTRRFSLTTAGSVMQNFMRLRELDGPYAGDRSYALTLYRYTIGIRYNPVRVIRLPGTEPY
jgi:hypothetical protein